MNNFLNNLNDKLANFMTGRNGTDKLARWCLGFAVVLALINLILPNIFCSILSYVLLIYCIFRMFSRNVSAREEENDKFENLLDRFKGKSSKGSSSKNINKQTKAAKKNTSTTVYFKCDECGQSLSVPRGKGTLKVTCPKCKHQTTIKS